MQIWLSGRGLKVSLFLFAWTTCAFLATGAPVGLVSTESSGKRTNQIGETVQEGISIKFFMEAVENEGSSSFHEGDLVRFRFQIRDTTSDTPLSGVFPAAWMDLRPDGEDATVELCRDKVGAFIGGSLLSPPELDLNVYFVLALNQDATISVVDPLFGFGTTKLLAMIFLDSPGEDWVLTQDQRNVFVSMPESNRVAVASTATWKVTKNVDVGPRPSKLALQPDGRYLWVGFDAPRVPHLRSGVSVIDTLDGDWVTDIMTGNGHHEIVFSRDTRFAFVTNSADGTVSVIDIRTLSKISDLSVGINANSMSYSVAADAVFVVDSTKGNIAVVDAQAHTVVTHIGAEPGLGQIKFTADGRLALVVHPDKDVVHIIDASLNRIVQTADVEDGPDQVAFSDELAYIRHRDSELVLMIPLDQIGREGQPVPVIDFPGGHTPFGRGSKGSLADSIVQAPGANAVLVANPADRAIYYYKEGMAAPMGHFQNYGRQPRATLALDRSLAEVRQGSYETIAKLTRPGLYDVAFYLDSPRTVHCFQVEVEPNAELLASRQSQRSVLVEPVFTKREFLAGTKVSLGFRLTHPLNHAPAEDVNDLRALTFRAPGLDSRRQWARVTKDGVYEIDFEPSSPGIYYVFLASQSLGLAFRESPLIILRVKGEVPLDDSGLPRDNPRF